LHARCNGERARRPFTLAGLVRLKCARIALRPHTIESRVYTIALPMQAYVHTSQVLNFGMCGAPVLSDTQTNNSGSGGSGSDGHCCGLVEGIVPPAGSPAAPPPEMQSPLYKRVQVR
jgi:hypothetical protein